MIRAYAKRISPRTSVPVINLWAFSAQSLARGTIKLIKNCSAMMFHFLTLRRTVMSEQNRERNGAENNEVDQRSWINFSWRMSWTDVSWSSQRVIRKNSSKTIKSFVKQSLLFELTQTKLLSTPQLLSSSRKLGSSTELITREFPGKCELHWRKYLPK